MTVVASTAAVVAASIAGLAVVTASIAGLAHPIVQISYRFEINYHPKYCAKLHMRLPSLRKTSPGVAVGGSPAFVFRADPTDDLAVIGSGYQNAKFAVFRAADDARAGEGIVAMGFPYGVTVTTGTISSTAGIGYDRRYFQITAPLLPCNYLRADNCNKCTKP